MLQHQQQRFIVTFNREHFLVELQYEIHFPCHLLVYCDFCGDSETDLQIACVNPPPDLIPDKNHGSMSKKATTPMLMLNRQGMGLLVSSFTPVLSQDQTCSQVLLGQKLLCQSSSTVTGMVTGRTSLGVFRE